MSVWPGNDVHVLASKACRSMYTVPLWSAIHLSAAHCTMLLLVALALTNCLQAVVPEGKLTMRERLAAKAHKQEMLRHSIITGHTLAMVELVAMEECRAAQGTLAGSLISDSSA